MKNLHLGLVGPVPPPNGGMAMQTRQLGLLLQNEGLQVTRVATNAQYRPAVVGGIPGLRALFRLVPYCFTIWRLAGKVSVIHLMANSGWSWQLYAAPVIWIAWLRATPVVVNYRGGEADTYFRRSFRYVAPTLRKAALVIVPSAYLEAVFAQFGVDSRIIPNIVDRNVFRPLERSHKSGRYTLVIARNLEPIYGIDTAIRAVAEVNRCGHSVVLRIAGTGASEPLLRSLVAELGLIEIVCFEGRLEHTQMVDLYSEADAMINPTTVDNMPNSVIEALACGLPVISTDVGGIPYIVEDGKTALLVPPNRPEEMAAAIIRLIGDEDLQTRLRSNGIAQVSDYTWPIVCDMWLDAYSFVSKANRGISA